MPSVGKSASSSPCSGPYAKELEVRIRLGLTPGHNVSDQQSDVPIYDVLDVLWGIIERVDPQSAPLENASVSHILLQKAPGFLAL